MQQARHYSQAKIDQIIELRMADVPVREVAKTVGCAVNTVTKYYNEYLTETKEDRTARLQRLEVEATRKIERNASDCRRAVVTAREKYGPLTKEELEFLKAEQKALDLLAKISGAYAPTKVDLSGEVITEVRWVEEVSDGTPDGS